jgi:hypothetical protein
MARVDRQSAHNASYPWEALWCQSGYGVLPRDRARAQVTRGHRDSSAPAYSNSSSSPRPSPSSRPSAGGFGDHVGVPSAVNSWPVHVSAPMAPPR